MSVRLLLLVGEFDGKDSGVDKILREWTAAGLLNVVAWFSVTTDNPHRPQVTLSENGEISQAPLFELLTSRIWNEVNVVAVRQENLASLDKRRFESELSILHLVEKSFDAHKDLEFNSFTCSIGEDYGLAEDAFSNLWNLHLLQEPIARIDEAVAAQPLWDDERHLLVALLAILAGGGFVWQFSGLVAELNDPVSGSHRPLRVGRAYLRVVSAGRLTDEILSGAFPASGPWSIPPDVPNARSVPPGSSISDSVVNALRTQGDFAFKNWVAPKKEKAEKLGLLAGILLFFKEYVAALKGIPLSLVGRVKGEIEDWMQKVTFGSDSSVLLKFDPLVDDLHTDDLVDTIKLLDLGAEIDPIGNSAPWMMLQQVALGAVDGGRFPSEVPVPMQGSYRLIYTDPTAIGPSPSDGYFEITNFERELLELSESSQRIGPMDLEEARTFQLRLDALRAEMNTEVVPTITKGVTAGSPKKALQKGNESAVATAKSKKPRFWQIRKKRKLKKALKIEEARRKSEAIAETLKRADKEKSEPELETAPSTQEVENSELDVNEISQDEATTPEDESTKTDTVVSGSDISRHKPSHPDFVPTEYIPLTAFYQGQRSDLASEYDAANRIYSSAISSYKAAKGLWSLNKSCDHCGTAFDHGVLYLHEPTQELVHVGHICARKVLPLPDETDLMQKKLTALEKRWSSWLSQRSGSLLWRVGQSIVSGLITSRTELARSLAILSERPHVEKGVETVQLRFNKWTRRGMFWFMMLVAASIASVVLTPLPLLLFAITLTVSFSGFLVRLGFLARDIVRAKYKLSVMMDEYERTYAKARHEVGEIVRLTSVREQFEDWQSVIREIVHVPFGRKLGFSAEKVGIEDVARPSAMVLGRSQPNDEQKMQLFLSARKQTIHGGWLTEIMDIAKEEWKKDYENARMTGPADNIVPESDNASSHSVVGKRPLSDEDVYYPRTDFKRRVLSGVLQEKLVQRKSEQVAEDLRRTSIENLLGTVDVSGLGSALNGMKVEDFLSGLSTEPDEQVAFPSDLISHVHAHRRVFFPETFLPPFGSLNAEAGQLQVQPGAELTAAAWRIELSEPLLPLDIFKGFVPRSYEGTQTEDPGEEKQSVV
jgi:hypothetical protein